ncbi:MAG TPA: hypothetical protein VFN96_01710, partial [Gemmatimonadales bacterium]|nr:hypothetical protein [Gemmatimonadales bacterium]
MNRPRIYYYVAGVTAAACGAMALSWGSRTSFPGVWPVVVLLLIAFLLQISSTDIRGGNAEGSLSFIAHLATGVLFGAFWGGVVAGLSTAMSQAAARREVLKAVFNIAQRTLSLICAILAYTSLGGTVPPDYLFEGAPWVTETVGPQILAFLAGALVYFALNSLLVSGAVAISAKKPLRKVWTTGYLWVLGYDI